MSDVYAWMTYRDIANQIGLATTEAAAARVRRAKWPKRLRDDTGEAEALVPVGAILEPRKPRKALAEATHTPAANELESISKAMAALWTKPTRGTVVRWLQTHPDLGLRIAGRRFVWRAAREAIGRGVPLDKAAAIGRACRERDV